MPNFELLRPEIQDFINKHIDNDPVKLLLKTSPFPGASMQEVAGQIQSKRKCKQKLPEWYLTPGIYYPSSLALEQCSSALTAAYKASLIQGHSLADITGGAGVDSYYFSKSFEKVLYIEQSAGLSALAEHNLSLLGAKNIRFLSGNGMTLLKQQGHFDCLFLDPSRRNAAMKKVFLPEDYEPDFLPRLDFLLSKAETLLIKTSPLVDLAYGLRSFKYVSAIHVVAVKNECKEALWVLNKTPVPDPSVICVDIQENKTLGFRFSLGEEAMTQANPLSGPRQYLYEPGAAILKAGAFKTLGQRFGLAKLHANSHLYTSGQWQQDFPGRSFKVRECLSPREFGKRFKGQKIHVSTRNFPEDTASILKKYRITGGGNQYAFFTTAGKNKRIVLLCEKANVV